MSDLSKRALFWAPRVLTIAFVVFLSLFAWDVLEEHLGFWMTVQALALHLLPCFVLIVVLLLSWRREWIGALVFAAAGLLYVISLVSMSHPVSPATLLLWALCIAGPAFLIAALFLANWWKHGELRTLRR